MNRDSIKEFFNSISDKWDNTEDDFSIIRSLLEEVGIKENSRVLDVACGKGVITPLLHSLSKTKVMAIDISDKMIDGALLKYGNNENYKFICGDFIDYHFQEVFDYVVIYNAYPHFLDVDLFKKKAYDILKDGGKLAIMHSLGRKRLNEHHNGILNISRILDLATIEADKYSDCFKVIKTIDEENRYLIVLGK